MLIPYRVLVVHNAYQHRGGEDSVVEAEIALLRSYGHQVETYFRSNDEIANLPNISVARQTLWSSKAVEDLRVIFDSFKPDIIHVHNTFPLISPAIYWLADNFNIPIVQTLHNFRLMCLNALYLRDDKVCEDCTGHLPWRGVINKCYRDSTPASLVLACMLSLHRGLGTFNNKISRYIALNDFCRNKFIDGGLPDKYIAVKPNFVDAPKTLNLPRHGFLFVGRLSVEKGISTLVAAINSLKNIELKIVGEGPISFASEDINQFSRLGMLSRDEVWYQMNCAKVLIVPSIWYETFGLVVVEAFAAGLPVIASRIGALAELIVDGETGLLFEPGNPDDLAAKMSWAQANPDQMALMGRNARIKYETEFTPQNNYQQLINIYHDVIREQRHEK